VVDCLRVKEALYEHATGTAKLVETWVSKASARQRRGRAGRVRPGVCYRLCPRVYFQGPPAAAGARSAAAADAAGAAAGQASGAAAAAPAHGKGPWGLLADQGVPEVKRTQLSTLCLQVKVLGLGSIGGFLGSLLDPPAPYGVSLAVQQLAEMGALAPTAGGGGGGGSSGSGSSGLGAAGAVDGELTPLGWHLAQLPLDPRLGKALIFGAVLRCIDPILTVVAALSDRSPFRPLPPTMEPEERAKIEAARARFNFSGAGSAAAGGIASNSDHVAVIRAYALWRAAGAAAGEGASAAARTRAQRAFADAHGLSHDGLRAMTDLRVEFAGILADQGFLVKPSAVGGSLGPRGGAGSSASAAGGFGGGRGGAGGGGGPGPAYRGSGGPAGTGIAGTGSAGGGEDALLVPTADDADSQYGEYDSEEEGAPQLTGGGADSDARSGSGASTVRGGDAASIAGSARSAPLSTGRGTPTASGGGGGGGRGGGRGGKGAAAGATSAAGGAAAFGRFGERAPGVNACSDQINVIRAALVAGLYPNVVKVVAPERRYHMTAHGSVPQEYSPAELKLFTLAEAEAAQMLAATAAGKAAAARGGGRGKKPGTAGAGGIATPVPAGGASDSSSDDDEDDGDEYRLAAAAEEGFSAAPTPSAAGPSSSSSSALLPSGGGGGGGASGFSLERLATKDGRRLVCFRGHWQERVWLHPGSVNFSVGEWRCPYMVYYEKGATGSSTGGAGTRPGAGPGAAAGSLGKVFVRDSTMVSPFAILLFGGPLRVHHDRGTITVGASEWVSFRAEPRIGALLAALRQALSGLLAAKVETPRLDVSASPVIEAILRLLLSG
jgi:hypothetical protein